MLITCNNRGCLKSSDALLDVKTDKVICGECKREITNVSVMMKKTLKSFGQIIRETKKAFMLACKSCNANREIVLDQKGNTLCKTCHSPIKIHPAFKIAIEESGGLEKIILEDDKK